MKVGMVDLEKNGVCCISVQLSFSGGRVRGCKCYHKEQGIRGDLNNDGTINYYSIK